MVAFEGIKHVLLDIEGTICSISFVKETLFPYALKALPTVLPRDWSKPEFQSYIQAFPAEHATSPASLQAHVEDLTARDVKAAALKNLQGYLWESGYKSGVYSTTLYPDVVPQLKVWKAAGQDLAIYSSGSVFAQKLLFEHVQKARGREVEDLRGLMSAWFDTTNAGLKIEKQSYVNIAKKQKWNPSEVLFLSDNVKEVEAATEAGMKVSLLERDGNAPLTDSDKATYAVVQRLDQLEVSPPTTRRSARLQQRANGA